MHSGNNDPYEAWFCDPTVFPFTIIPDDAPEVPEQHTPVQPTPVGAHINLSGRPSYTPPRPGRRGLFRRARPTNPNLRRRLTFSESPRPPTPQPATPPESPENDSFDYDFFDPTKIEDYQAAVSGNKIMYKQKKPWCILYKEVLKEMRSKVRPAREYYAYRLPLNYKCVTPKIWKARKPVPPGLDILKKFTTSPKPKILKKKSALNLPLKL